MRRPLAFWARNVHKRKQLFGRVRQFNQEIKSVLKTDEERFGFLQDLDKAVTKGVEVTDWEAKFIEFHLKYHSANPGQKMFFTPKQQAVIEGLYMKYQPKL